MPREGTVIAAGEPLDADRAYRDAVKRHHFVPELGQHPANLAVLSLGQNQLEHIGLALTADESGPLGANLAVRQPDSRRQLGQNLLIRRTGDERTVHFFNAITRMSQPIRQLAVVGQDHQSGAFLVESTDRVNAFGNLCEEINNAGPARRVGAGRDVSFRLVDRVIHHGLTADRFTVDRDSCSIGIDPSAELADDLSIDCNATLPDQLLTASTRAKTGMRQHFLNAFKFSGAGFGIRMRAGTARVAVVVIGFLRAGLTDRRWPRTRARAAWRGICSWPPIRSRRFVVARIAARHCSDLLQSGRHHKDLSARDRAIGRFSPMIHRIRLRAMFPVAQQLAGAAGHGLRVKGERDTTQILKTYFLAPRNEGAPASLAPG